MRNVALPFTVGSVVLLLILLSPACFAIPRAIVEQVKAATVFVEVSDGSGTAFAVDHDGDYVTADHVVDGSVRVRLIKNSGQPNQTVSDGTVVREDKLRDLALIRSDDTSAVTPLSFSTDADIYETESATAFGFPFGRDINDDNTATPTITVNPGHVTALRMKGAVLDSVQFDAAVNPGNSGGPLVDDDGHVVGIVDSTIEDANAVNFAIPAGSISAFLDAASVSLSPSTIDPQTLGATVKFTVTVLCARDNYSPSAVKVTFVDNMVHTRTIIATPDTRGVFEFSIAPHASSIQYIIHVTVPGFDDLVVDGSLESGSNSPQVGQTLAPAVSPTPDLTVNGSSPAPIKLSGFNANVVMSRSGGAVLDSVDDNTMCLFETGVKDSTGIIHAGGLSAGMFYSSFTNSITPGHSVFQIQPFNGNDVVYMRPSGGNRGRLTLTTPAAYKSIAILATAVDAASDGMGTITLNFTDGTSSSTQPYIAYDWSSGKSNQALGGIGARQISRDNDQYEGPDHSLYETDIDLQSLGFSTKPIQSIDLTGSTVSNYPGFPGVEPVTIVFAISGVAEK